MCDGGVTFFALRGYRVLFFTVVAAFFKYKVGNNLYLKEVVIF